MCHFNHLVEHVFEKFLKNILKFFIAKNKNKKCFACKISPKNSSHAWDDLFVSDIHVVTSAVD